jgi:Raf kinase inhibitor-like YbhB/YbcL family protein
MRAAVVSVFVLVVSTLAYEAPAAPAKNADGPPILAKQLLPARGGGTKLMVTSDALLSGAPMDERFTQNGDGRSPPVSWSKGPTGTLSYALLIEDGSVNRPEPIAHWVVYDVPGTTLRIGENQPKDGELPGGAMQGLNVRKEIGFVGPKPPAGETHNYHLQVFALNTRIHLKPDETDRDKLVQAMKGHVLASGDLVVNYTGK